MLVLTRKLSESIKIGNDVVITVTQISHGKVKLGIHAPANVRILRSELNEFPSNSAPLADESARRSEVERIEDLPLTADVEFPLEFSTEYAAEIEDQMLCLVSH